MVQHYEVGQAIIYVDEYGVPHNALATIWHCGPTRRREVFEGKLQCVDEHEGKIYPCTEACCNLVYVTTDSMKRDDYGRQIERQSSVCHKSSMGGCHGRYWIRPDEK